MKPYDLAIAYRIYPGVSKTPVVSPTDKFTLAHLCLKSFKKSLSKLNVKIWAILDGCPDQYEQIFKRYFESSHLEIIRVDKIGNRATFGLQLDILLSQNDAEIVYFAEDDYYYEPDQFPQMINFLRENQDAQFVSPFDHPDYYRLDLHRHKYSVRTHEKHDWRTVNSTCLTFMTSKNTLRKTESVFRSYSRTRNADASIWLSLTKVRVFNPLKTIQYILFDNLLRKIMVKLWMHSWRQILFGKRWVLWTPLPTIATTVESSCLALGQDWESILSRELRNLH